ncbi:MAG TPA: hypothetical protein VK822_01680 [Acetobacteraceae bacterium]|jgi:hypothetical protein|nr:hypothetical protein [Acetobacteraceae bacterium]
MTDTENATAAVDATDIHHGTVLMEPDPKDTRPWTIKGMPEWAIDHAKNAATARGISQGRWLTEVISMAAQQNGEADRSLPVKPQVPAVVRHQASPGLTDVSQIAEAVEIAKQVSLIEGLPRTIVREANGLLRDRLKAARRCTDRDADRRVR